MRKYSENNASKISDATLKSYNITRLYQRKTNSNIVIDNNPATIIGSIEIPKLSISYPIFSEYSENLLKISVCKLYGPNLNVEGNLCIIGHNYNNGDFFSNLHLLNFDDTIYIYDLYSNYISYHIYKIYEVSPDDLKYLSPINSRY